MGARIRLCCVSTSKNTEQTKCKLRSLQMRSCLFLETLRGIVQLLCRFRVLGDQVNLVVGLVIPELFSVVFSTASKGVLLSKLHPYGGSCVREMKKIMLLQSTP